MYGPLPHVAFDTFKDASGIFKPLNYFPLFLGLND